MISTVALSMKKSDARAPECNFTNTPQYDIFMDLIGPWSVKTENFNGQFYALTCIDTPTNLVEPSTLSWKCPGHVPDMSSGWGHVLKSQGQNQMAGHIFCRNFLVTCPLHVLEVSHVCNTLKKEKENANQSNLPNLFGGVI